MNAQESPENVGESISESESTHSRSLEKITPMTLYVVSTPIGNLDDITLRALKILKGVSFILAEDTRRTRELLSYYSIAKQIFSFHEHSSAEELKRYLHRIINEQLSVALVTDAGTPLISDPGNNLVSAVWQAGGRVVAIPGASAVLCALAASGLIHYGFRFLGFLPRTQSERLHRLTLIAHTEESVVLYEAGNRVPETLSLLASHMPQRQVAIGRELTKKHEEFYFGSAKQLATSITEPLRGEVVLVLGPHTQVAEVIDDHAVKQRIEEALEQGKSPKDVTEWIQAWSGRPKREVYALVIEAKQARSRRDP